MESVRKVYFGVGGEADLIRSMSHGYKSIVMSEDLGMGNIVEFDSDNDTLVMNPVDGKAELSKDAITFVCDSFGVCGIKSKISVIFCDDGRMVVTLYHGLLHINFDGKIISPSCGEVDMDKGSRSGIKWVDIDTMLAMRQYFGTDLQQRYYQDFEYFFEVSGGSDKSDCHSWSCRCLRDEYIDMSLGFIAETEEKIMRRNRQNQVNRMVSMFTQPAQEELYVAGVDDEEDYDEDEDDF